MSNLVKKPSFSQIKKKACLSLTSLASLGAANFALAIDDAAVTAAYTAGTASVNNAVLGLIGLMAVIVGVSAVIGLLKRG